MVRRRSCLNTSITSKLKQLGSTLGYSQSVNLYLVYDFSQTNTFTTTPLRRRLMRRKYYSGTLLKTTVLHFWLQEYRFYKLRVSHLTNLFFFKNNSTCYNFVKFTKFNPSQTKLSEVFKLTTLPSRVLTWNKVNNLISKLPNNLFLSHFEKKPLQNNVPATTVALPNKTYLVESQNLSKSTLLNQVLNLVSFINLLAVTKTYYQIFSLTTLNNL